MFAVGAAVGFVAGVLTAVTWASYPRVTPASRTTPRSHDPWPGTGPR